MATTKIWTIKGSVGSVLRYIQDDTKTDQAKQTDDLDSVLHYIGNEGKTDAKRFVSGINCNPATARKDMQRVKKMFHKPGGIVAYHAYQSFAPGEVTPEQAHEIGIRLANELWGERFQVVVATHLDKESHLHNHFAVNSVSFVDGKRFRCNIDFYNRMREVSDRLCREHNLSVIQNQSKKRSKNYAEYTAEKAGKPTWRGTIKSDIDKSIAESYTERQFFDALRRMGYEYKIGQDISVRPPGKERFFRLARNLGDDYTLEKIRHRLGKTRPIERPFVTQTKPVKRHYRLRGSLPKSRKSHLRRMYLYYCYRLGVFKKHPQSPARMHFLLREDLKDLDKYTREIRMLHTYRIDTDVQLLSFQEGKQQELDQLSDQRQVLRNKLRSITDPEQTESTKKQIEQLTKSITKNRKEIKLCDDIYTRSAEIARKLEIIHKDEAEHRREELQHGYQRASR